MTAVSAIAAMSAVSAVSALSTAPSLMRFPARAIQALRT
jgi:hypothetical protein